MRRLVRSPAIWFAIGILLVWGAQFYLAATATDHTDRGTFGDAFGAVNALFSGLAFVGLIYAILLQRQELELQRKELENTRNELRGTREAQEKQNTFIELQMFEGTFFQLLRNLSDIIEAIDLVDDHGGVTKGRDAIAAFYRRLERELPRHKKVGEDPAALSTSVAAYEVFYKENSHELGHYFRMLYNIIKFVDRSTVTDKKQYLQIVRAQMSDLEANLQLYNCITDRAAKMRVLVEKYHLLKYVNDTRLLGKDHKNFLAPSAFVDDTPTSPNSEV